MSVLKKVNTLFGNGTVVISNIWGLFYGNFEGNLSDNEIQSNCLSLHKNREIIYIWLYGYEYDYKNNTFNPDDIFQASGFEKINEIEVMLDCPWIPENDKKKITEWLNSELLKIEWKNRAKFIRNEYQRNRDKLFKQMIESGLSYECAIPGCNNKNIQIDHIRPVTKGGTSNLENLQFLCAEHNREKGDTFNE